MAIATACVRCELIPHAKVQDCVCTPTGWWWVASLGGLRGCVVASVCACIASSRLAWLPILYGARASFEARNPTPALSQAATTRVRTPRVVNYPPAMQLKCELGTDCVGTRRVFAASYNISISFGLVSASWALPITSSRHRIAPCLLPASLAGRSQDGHAAPEEAMRSYWKQNTRFP